MSTPQVTWDAPASAPAAAPQVKWDDEQPKQQPGFLDKEIPLDSYKDASLSGAQSIGRGFRGIYRGVGQTLAHPIDTAKNVMQGVSEIPSTLAQVPGAIHDINQSPDPIGTYAKVGQETAGQGAAQALTALGTEGVARAVPKIASVAKPVVRAGLKTASDIVDPDITGLASPRLAHAQRLAGRLAEKMEPKPVYPGAHLPEAPDPGVLHGPDEYPITNTLHGPDEYPITNILHGPEAPEPITNVQHGPEAPPNEVLKARGLATGGQPVPEPQAAPLGKIPVRIAKPNAPMNNEMPWGGIGDRPPIEEAPKQSGPIPGSKEDLAETKGIQEDVREMGEREDRARQSAIKSDWFKRNGPQQTKGQLTGTAKQPSNPIAGKRMDFSEGGTTSGKVAPAGIRIPRPDEDLRPLLKQSIEAAKKKKGD